jgi:carbon-monoxide dehydrogenase medium subunit
MKYYLFHANSGKGAGPMKPAPFEYMKASSVDECLEVLESRGPEVKLLAGGQSLVPLMNLRLTRPEVVVDVNGLADLSYERRDDGVLELGALRRHTELAESSGVAECCPLVADAASRIGYPAIRNRGTLGGSLAHADPAAELPCACVTLGAELVVRGPAGERRVPAADFFVSHFTTTLAPAEMVVAVRVPAQRPRQGSAFEELARKTGDFALVAVGALLSLSGKAVGSAAVAVAGVGGRPLRMPAAEALVAGEAPSEELFAAAGKAVADEVGSSRAPGDDGFRAEVAGVLAARALASACRRAAFEEINNAN